MITENAHLYTDGGFQQINNALSLARLALEYQSQEEVDNALAALITFMDYSWINDDLWQIRINHKDFDEFEQPYIGNGIIGTRFDKLVKLAINGFSLAFNFFIHTNV